MRFQLKPTERLKAFPQLNLQSGRHGIVHEPIGNYGTLPKEELSPTMNLGIIPLEIMLNFLKDDLKIPQGMTEDQ